VAGVCGRIPHDVTGKKEPKPVTLSTTSWLVSVPVASLRLGLRDLEILAKEFYPEFSFEDLINLPNYSIYLKLMIEGRVSKPFSAETITEVRSNGP
jgi:hypothetical protein